MKVLLIYPPREHYIFGITPHVYIESDAGYYPPIGLLYLAGYLKKFSDVEIYVLDAYTEKMNHQQVKNYIQKLQPDVVGVYFSTYYLYDGIITVKNIKEISKEIITVVGGPHTAFYPKETIEIPEVDYVIVGEAEKSFNQLIKSLKEKKFSEIDNMPNVVSKKNLTKTLFREVIADLDELPFPARELLDYKKYSSILAKKNPITTIITSRGCPFKCYFCSNIESGQKVRYRSAKNVVDEIQDAVERFGIYDFLFFDELFTSNRQRVIDICNEIIRRGLKIRWHCRSRADVLDEEMIKKMKKSGCRLIQFGIETGSQRLQKVINKNLDLEKVRKIITMVYKHGIYTYADFMFGLPSETEDETRNTLKFAKLLNLDYIAFGMFHPDVGSVFYEQGLKENRFTDFCLEFVKNYGMVPVFDHSWTGKDREKYHDMISFAYRNFYLRPTYCIKHLLRLDSFEQIKWQIFSAIKVFGNFIIKKYR
ncbi:MAG: radical SAM protein [Endomicrobiia bacterium]